MNIKEKITELEKELQALKEEVEREEEREEERPFPQNNDKFKFLSSWGEIKNGVYNSQSESDQQLLSIGNVFRTEEEAEFALEKLKVIHELKQFSSPPKSGEDNYSLYCYINQIRNTLSIKITNPYQYSTLYFDSKETAEKAIEAVGKERILKYYLEVQDVRGAR